MANPRTRVLLVDDYPDALESWSLLLSVSGYDVITAEDGQAAIEAVWRERPDVVVMDLDLPVLTGMQAARLLRAEPASRFLPLIAATGHSQPGQIDAARRAGFDVVLIKPCEPDQLIAEIDRLIGSPHDGGVNGGQRIAHS